MATNGKQIRLYNLVFIFVSVIDAIIILSTPQAGALIEKSAEFGPFAPLFAGAFYSDVITAPAATAVIFYLGKVQNPFFVALIGAFGSVAGDYIIFRYIRKRGIPEIAYLARRLKIKNKHPYAKYVAMVIAAIIIASPLPDEIGAAIFGALKVKTKYFLVISYTLNFLGILTVAWLGSVL